MESDGRESERERERERETKRERSIIGRIKGEKKRE